MNSARAKRQSTDKLFKPHRLPKLRIGIAFLLSMSIGILTTELATGQLSGNASNADTVVSDAESVSIESVDTKRDVQVTESMPSSGLRPVIDGSPIHPHDVDPVGNLAETPIALSHAKDSAKFDFSFPQEMPAISLPDRIRLSQKGRSASRSRSTKPATPNTGIVNHSAGSDSLPAGQPDVTSRSDFALSLLLTEAAAVEDFGIGANQLIEETLAGSEAHNVAEFEILIPVETVLTMDAAVASAKSPFSAALPDSNVKVDIKAPEGNESSALLIADVTAVTVTGRKSRDAELSAAPISSPVSQLRSAKPAAPERKKEQSADKVTSLDLVVKSIKERNSTPVEKPDASSKENSAPKESSVAAESSKDAESPVAAKSSAKAIADNSVPAKSSATETNATKEVTIRQDAGKTDLAMKGRSPKDIAPEIDPKSDRPPAPDQVLVPKEPRVVITRQMSYLRPKLQKTLRFYDGKPLNTKDDSAWSVMHSILGYGVDGMVAINSKRGRRVNAVSWMANNNLLMNRRLLYIDGGYLRGREGPGFQGHPCQFLAMLAQVNLKRDYPLRVQGRSLSVEDLINSEMYTCAANRELTFKLIALSHYLPSDASWLNEKGEVWNLPRILKAELSQPVNGAACGGTHRIMAITYAVKTKELRGEPLEGVYLQAQKYIEDYQRYAFSLQNRDGSFSSDWFKRRSDWGDKDRQLQTTGHILEWLVYALPRNKLSDRRIVASVEFLNQLMTRHRYHDWEVGPRGHALRALSLYHQRVFEQPRAGTPVIAAVPTLEVLR